jgi:hypothetical protein
MIAVDIEHHFQTGTKPLEPSLVTTEIHVYGADNVLAGELLPSRADPAPVLFVPLNLGIPAKTAERSPLSLNASAKAAALFTVLNTRLDVLDA